MPPALPPALPSPSVSPSSGAATLPEPWPAGSPERDRTLRWTGARDARAPHPGAPSPLSLGSPTPAAPSTPPVAPAALGISDLTRTPLPPPRSIARPKYTSPPSTVRPASPITPSPAPSSTSLNASFPVSPVTAQEHPSPPAMAQSSSYGDCIVSHKITHHRPLPPAPSSEQASEDGHHPTIRAVEDEPASPSAAAGPAFSPFPSARASDASASPSEPEKAAAPPSDELERARHQAELAWNEDPRLVPREHIITWLGRPGVATGPTEAEVSEARRAYMAHFDFKGQRVDGALRVLCGKLLVRAETQVLDRVLDAFAHRFQECNAPPLAGGVYRTPEVVHHLAYSVLLLNTDLHVADLGGHMTRNQFVHNTLHTLTPEDDDGLSLFSSDRAPSPDSPLTPAPLTPTTSSNSALSHVPFAQRPLSPSPRSSPHKPRRRHLYRPPIHSTVHLAPFTSDPVWTNEMENILKEMYSAVRAEQIRLPSWSGEVLGGPQTANRGNKRDARRTSIRGLPALLMPSGNNALRFNELSLSPSAGASGIGGEVWSPRPSAPVGFASSLSQSIIPEEKPTPRHAKAGLSKLADVGEDDGEFPPSPTQAAKGKLELPPPVPGQTSAPAPAPDPAPIQDTELALVGPPWAKEGVLQRKQFIESDGRRSKNKSWLQVFAVVHDPGVLSLFRFDSTSSSGGGAVGGGNWALNAHQVGEIPLQHATAQVLPPPGYSRTRPHVVSLHLASGAVVYLETSHEGLAVEWCVSLNYWAARTSHLLTAEPVTSVDFGWKFLEQPESAPHSDPSSALGPGSDQTSSGPTAPGTRSNPSPTHLLSPRSPSEGNLPATLTQAVSDAGSSAASLIELTRPSTSGTGRTSLQASEHATETATPAQEERHPPASLTKDAKLGAGNPLRRGMSYEVLRAQSTTGAHTGPPRRGLSGLGKALRGLGVRMTGAEGPASGAGLDVAHSRNWRSPSPNEMGKNYQHERDFIGTWVPPTAPLRVSTLAEPQQLGALQDTVMCTERLLALHQAMRSPMLARYYPRGNNAALARANWERKQHYLLEELSKYRSYVTVLRGARDKRARLRRRPDGTIVDPLVDPLDETFSPTSPPNTTRLVPFSAVPAKQERLPTVPHP